MCGKLRRNRGRSDAGNRLRSSLGLASRPWAVPSNCNGCRGAALMFRNYFSLRRHSGHCRTCCWLDPVANDPVRTQSCGRYAHRASRPGAAAFAVAPTLLRDRFNYSAPSTSSASLSRHMVRISTLLQRDLCRTLRLPQFLDARFEPCDVFVCPREGKLTKFKGLR